MEVWESKPHGTLWATPCLLRESLPVPLIITGSHSVEEHFSPPLLFSKYTLLYAQAFRCSGKSQPLVLSLCSVVSE